RGVRVPAPRSRWCTARVLVMDRLPGTPLGAGDTVLAGMTGQRRREVAAALLGTMLDQVLETGMFHVDVHPGNVLVDADGTLGLLDLGSVGRLDGTTRAALGRLMAALGRSDSAAATDALLELVDRPDEIDERELERTLGGLIVRYAAPGAGTGAAAFGALMRLVTTHRLAIPPQVAAVFRAFATLEGTLVLIDPAFDLVAEARRAGVGRVAEALTPQRLRDSVTDEVVALLPVLRRLPRRVDRIADALEHGRLGVNVRVLADRRDRQLVTGLVHQVLLTVLGTAAGLIAVRLLGIPGGPRVTRSIELYDVLGYGLFIVSFVLVLRVLILIFRRSTD
ncbi:AarF/UbiB family protein, partial [Micromonospora zhanjiangensis]